MKIKIICDGTQLGTRIFGVLEDGTEHMVTNVVSVSIRIRAGDDLRAEITIDNPVLDIALNTDGAVGTKTMDDLMLFDLRPKRQ